MMEFKVMVKGKHNKRFVCLGHHTEAKRADRNAQSLARDLWTAEVKVVCTDGSLREELRYK